MWCAGHVKVMAEDEWAHIVLVAALSFTDDTALMKKAIVPELLVQIVLPISVSSRAQAENWAFQRLSLLQGCRICTGSENALACLLAGKVRGRCEM